MIRNSVLLKAHHSLSSSLSAGRQRGHQPPVRNMRAAEIMQRIHHGERLSCVNHDQENLVYRVEAVNSVSNTACSGKSLCFLDEIIGIISRISRS
jgi:hypothetical protein